MPLLYCVFCCWLLIAITTKLVTCPCRCQSIYTFTSIFSACRVSSLSCLIIIKVLYERSAWWDVGFSGSPLSCLLFSLYSVLSYVRCRHLQAHLTLILHWRNNYNLDLKLFPHITQPRDYLRHFLPRLLRTALIKAHSLRKRQHYYQLPRVEYSPYKNSFINRCLFNFQWLY